MATHARQLLPPTNKTQEIFVKNSVLAVTVLALCSLSFAGVLSSKKINLQQEAAAAAAQDAAAQAVLHGLFSTSTCCSPSPPAPITPF
jgi:hypothetical protein